MCLCLGSYEARSTRMQPGLLCNSADSACWAYCLGVGPVSPKLPSLQCFVFHEGVSWLPYAEVPSFNMLMEITRH